MSRDSNNSGAILDHWTEQSVAHASYILACVFGIFSVLIIMEEVGWTLWTSILLIFIYFTIVLFGDYEIGRWKTYATQAQELANKLIAKSELAHEVLNELKKRSVIRGVEETGPIKWLFDHAEILFYLFCVLCLITIYFEIEALPYVAALSIFFGIIGMYLLEYKNIQSKLSSMVFVTKVILLIGMVLSAFFLGYCFGYIAGRNNARAQIISKIARHEEVSLELSSNEVLTQLEQIFAEELNYTQLLAWQSRRINYTEERIERHTNPIEILNYGLGRCGEFSILYVAICLANDIPARLVTDLVVDHVWAEVNPSKDGETWIHVEPTDSCVRIQKGEKSIYDAPATVDNPALYNKKDFQMVFAFQVTEKRQVLIIDRTSIYSP